MTHRYLSATTMALAVGLAMAAGAAQAQDKDLPQVVKDNVSRATAQHLEKCYGVNKAGKNDCAVGKHSCAGQSTRDRDSQSIVLLPAGDCSKIAGGSTSAS